MKYTFLIVAAALIISACDSSVDTPNAEIKPLGASEIKSIQINGNEVKVTVSYGTPTPCWYYYYTESSNFRNSFVSKVFGKYDGEYCIQILGSFDHTETILFMGSGSKTLRFWQNDSTYLDTVIVIP